MSELRFSYGVMSAGKSTLALPVELADVLVPLPVLCRRHWMSRQTACADRPG